MTHTHLTPSDTDPHARAALLIPWAVNDTLQGEELAWLCTHLGDCADCRRDHEAQQRLREALQPTHSLLFAAEPSFQKLMARIGASEAAAPARDDTTAAVQNSAPRTGAVRASGGRTTLRWLAAAVLVEALALGVAGAGLWQAQRARPAYVTLTAPDPAWRPGARVHVVFRPDLPVAALGEVVRESGARLIEGPGDGNVYTLGFASDVTPGTAALRIAALRANAGVLFAEPAGGGPPR